MKLPQYQKLIQNLPVKDQAFEINRVRWLSGSHQIHKIQAILSPEPHLILNRRDLFRAGEEDLEGFMLKTLMWGYPTKGRGNNIEKVLSIFEKLREILREYQGREISNSQMMDDIGKIPGLGLSTMTKFIHFLRVRVEGIEALIFDRMVMDALNSDRFEEFEKMPPISVHKSGRFYPKYLEWTRDQSAGLDCYPDQLEYFLYRFALNLSYDQ